MEPTEQQRSRVAEDLRGIVAGDVRCDDVFLQLYASDASVYQIRPLGVVRPRSTDDVIACVQYAADVGIPVHPRGAGTGAAGESIGPGLIMDFSAYMRRVVRIDTERVRVQPGIVHERLNRQLRRSGRLFAPEPYRTNVATIGGMIGRNDAGPRWSKYGATRDHVLSLQVVLADGTVHEFSREPVQSVQTGHLHPRKRQILARLAQMLADHSQLIRQRRPNCPVYRGGYDLDGLLCQDAVDLARLMVGSEGTLGIVTEATLATQAVPQHRGVAILLFDSLDKAVRAGLDIVALGATACELVDRRCLTLARESQVEYELLIPAETEALLVVEYQGDDGPQVREWIEMLIDNITHQRRMAFSARQALDDQEGQLYWGLVSRPPSAMYRVRGPSRPVPALEDIAVAPQILPEFLPRMQNVLKRWQVTASISVHIALGQLRIRPFLDIDGAGQVDHIRRLADELYTEVLDCGGAICGEHACGLSRTPYLRRQVGPLYEVFVAVKRLLDPQNLLNPAKIVGEDFELPFANLRPALQVPAAPPEAEVADRSDAAAVAVADSTPTAAGHGVPPVPEPAQEPVDRPSQLRNLVELQLNWHPERLIDAVADCNRCGECRTQAGPERMCPIFRFAPAEESSPRAKANLVRGLLTGEMPLSLLSSEPFKQVLDLCVHCHSCRLECPARVDIPRLASQCKASYVTVNGLSWGEWVVTRAELLLGLASLCRPAANWALSNRFVRWLMEKVLGIEHQRKLPRLAATSFMRWAAKRKLTRPARHSDPKVAYFVDLYANYFDPQLAQAFVAVLEHNGIAVYVPAEQVQSGMAAVAAGDLDYARRIARHNVALLAEAIRLGYQVVATEPAAAVCLTHEYPLLLDEEDARLVAGNVTEACTFLWRLHTVGRLDLSFRPLRATVGYHTPCHLRALQVGSPGENLLGLIPGLRVRHIEEGCSGMAGAWGLLHRNYRNSLRAGWRLMSHIREAEIQAGTTECSACKLQMEQGTTKPTVHPIKLLALSYGLMPELAGLLASRGKSL